MVCNVAYSPSLLGFDFGSIAVAKSASAVWPEQINSPSGVLPINLCSDSVSVAIGGFQRIPPTYRVISAGFGIAPDVTDKNVAS